MAVLRFLMLLALVVWIGGIVFFGAVVAPTVFTVLPTHELAGNVVARSLGILHWMGIVSGIVFVLTSMTDSRLANGAAQPFAARHVMIYAMIALTAISQFVVFARMDALRMQMGIIDQVAPANPLRVSFDALHVWSTRLEGAVLILGLAVLYITAKRFHQGIVYHH